MTAIHDWLPSTLATAPVETTTHVSDYLPALGMTVASSVGLLAFGVMRSDRRKI